MMIICPAKHYRLVDLPVYLNAKPRAFTEVNKKDIS